MADSKKEDITTCYYCGEVLMKDNALYTESYPNEGPSTIAVGHESFMICDASYCGLSCFIKQVKKALRLRS